MRIRYFINICIKISAAGIFLRMALIFHDKLIRRALPICSVNLIDDPYRKGFNDLMKEVIFPGLILTFFWTASLILR